MCQARSRRPPHVAYLGRGCSLGRVCRSPRTASGVRKCRVSGLRRRVVQIRSVAAYYAGLCTARDLVQGITLAGDVFY
jgi:hypothetical protein